MLSFFQRYSTQAQQSEVCVLSHLKEHISEWAAGSPFSSTDTTSWQKPSGTFQVQIKLLENAYCLMLPLAYTSHRDWVCWSQTSQKKKKKERMQNQHISMSKLLVNACRCRLCLRTQRDSGFINHLNHSKRIIIIYHRGRVCLCLKKKTEKNDKVKSK